MKLEKYIDNSKKKRKIVLISISAIVLISISFLLYKTFASFTESAEFPIMNGKVDYFGNSDVYFVFYKDDEELDEMPQKGNEEDLVFKRGNCDNGASIEWDKNEWAPLVKNLSKSKTKCSLYFAKQEYAQMGGINIPLTENGDGLYTVSHYDLKELGNEWNKIEYRYAGVNPNNYVRFNNEIWRIIGFVNVKTESGIEQRVKIIRKDGINGQKDFGNYAWDHNEKNNWNTASLKDMLNGIYYESSNGQCYIGNNGQHSVLSNCDFSGISNLPKGLNDTAKNMIDSDVIWNLGGWTNNRELASTFYEKERGNITADNYPTEWSNTTDIGNKHNGVGLMYPSDYGYSIGGNERNKCLQETIVDYASDKCKDNSWLLHVQFNSLLAANTSYNGSVFYVHSNGALITSPTVNSLSVWPVVYLTVRTKIIEGNGTIEEPYILSVQ